MNTLFKKLIPAESVVENAGITVLILAFKAGTVRGGSELIVAFLDASSVLIEESSVLAVSNASVVRSLHESRSTGNTFKFSSSVKVDLTSCAVMSTFLALAYLTIPEVLKIRAVQRAASCVKESER